LDNIAKKKETREKPSPLCKDWFSPHSKKENKSQKKRKLARAANGRKRESGHPNLWPEVKNSGPTTKTKRLESPVGPVLWGPKHRTF